jgi:hypothetical protein
MEALGRAKVAMKATMELGVRVPEDVFVQQIESESAILRLTTECYFGLDDVATQMWAALTTSPTIGDAHRKLLEHFDVPAGVLERDLLELVDQLVERELLALRAA